MKAISKMTQAEVAAFVQSHLRKHQIYVTLSGGAAVSIYTVNRYVSADIDLVEDAYTDRSKIKIAMEEIGFREKIGISSIRTHNISLNFRPVPSPWVEHQSSISKRSGMQPEFYE